jgi:hypothetical protein
MGNYLCSAAQELGICYKILDVAEAETHNKWMQRYYWRLRGKRPAKLSTFAEQTIDECCLFRPSLVLTTGNRAPLEGKHLDRLRALGCTVANYSTDDPWNPVLHAPWFVKALPHYDVVFTPRHANMGDFRSSGTKRIHYLPFGYDPEVHNRRDGSVSGQAVCDLMFVGGCDDERFALINALAQSGLQLALFGQYWNTHSETRRFWRGVADQTTICEASATASIILCLVRRANRDGHVMRSFEAAAIGGCILAEDTADHRLLFGEDGARYFTSISELVLAAKALVADSSLRKRLACRLRERMTERKDTYADRLNQILQISLGDQYSAKKARR